MQNTFDEFLRNTPPITMRYGLTFHSGRMRPARARSSGSETLSPIRSSAGYIIDMRESDFSEATTGRRSRGFSDDLKSARRGDLTLPFYLNCGRHAALPRTAA